MDLSPEEEHVFAAIASQLEGRRPDGIPWSMVAACALVVGVLVVATLPLGVHHHLATLFYGTFLLALTGGLGLVALLNRRARPRQRRSGQSPERRRGGP